MYTENPWNMRPKLYTINTRQKKIMHRHSSSGACSKDTGWTYHMYKLERHLAALLTHVDISVMDQQVQGWKNLLNCPHRWWWVFVSTQIHNHPCHISQEADWDIRFDKGEQRMHYTQGNYIVSKLGAISNYITCNSTSSPPVTKPMNETKVEKICWLNKYKVTT